MDIDKVYRLAGGALKRFWKLYISKPFRDYNVESRATKAISKSKPEAAQWHDATQAAFKEAKKFTDRSFEQYNRFDDKLADRLRSVRVLSKDEEVEIEKNQHEKDKSRYPADRLGMAMPYVFQKPDHVPPGKLTVYGALDLLLERRNNEGGGDVSVEAMAARHNLAAEDLRLIFQYVDVFMAVHKGERHADVAYLNEQLLEDSGEVDHYDALNDPKKLSEREVLVARTTTEKEIEAKSDALPSSQSTQQQQQKQKEVVAKVNSKSGS